MAPLPTPSKQTKRPPLFPTYSRAYKKTSSQNIFHFYILSLTLFLYYLCTIYYYLS